LGLGDIVIPGIFMSLCLRFDVLKRLDINKLESIIEAEKKGTTSAANGSFYQYVSQVANSAPKHYFISVVIGYLIAIITTIVIMFIFNHGQPALLYLVPGCLFSVAITAAVKGEFSQVLEFVEEKYYGQEENAEKKDK
jgi:minor histocompatibility antigen H13